MVKDSAKYAATGGWGFATFVDGKAADASRGSDGGSPAHFVSAEFWHTTGGHVPCYASR
jgi:hypothetical protein